MGLVSEEVKAETFDESKHKGPHGEGPNTPKEKFKEASGQKSEGEKLEEWKKKTAPKDGGTVNPDADGGGGVPTEDDLARAITVHGADTDFVEGHGTHIEGDTPPKRPGDLVTDGGDEDPGAGDPTTTATPPGQQISHPVNPQDGLPGTAPSGSGTGGGNGGGGDGDGRQGGSAAATAATAETPSASSGVTNIGGGSSSGGIQTIANGDDDITSNATDTDTAPATDSEGRASQSYAMMTEEERERLENKRANEASEPVATQPAQQPTDDITGLGTGTAISVDATPRSAHSDDLPAAVATATVVELSVEVVEVEAAELVPSPLDPVADAISGPEDSLHVATGDTFTPLAVDTDELELPEVDLDDGF
jgi:hypothetical protein